jgi:death on curing protein
VGLLDSALARPRNLLVDERPDIAGLAAAYAFGIAQNHPFVDRNKRVSFVVTDLFPDLNGYRLDLSDGGRRTRACGRRGREDDLRSGCKRPSSPSRLEFVLL